MNDRRLRIALVGPPWLPVPPPGYGGIELVLSLLADGLADAGHEVTLFAPGGSETRAELVSTYDEPVTDLIGQGGPELRHALAAARRAGDFDVVNDHSGVVGAAACCLGSAPVVHTCHGPLDGGTGEVYTGLAELAPNLSFISISKSQREPRPDLPWIATCYNALDPSLYPFDEEPGDALVCLARMSADKGCHTAIEVARKAGLPLRIAAKCNEPDEHEYYESEIAPGLGGEIEYVGEVDQDGKIELLTSARALLFPIQWREPFGLAMIEAMACGTPVIAFPCGSVPEVVADGETGFVVPDADAMVAAVEHLDEIDPHACRRRVEEHFAPAALVRQYEDAYRRALARSEGDGDRET